MLKSHKLTLASVVLACALIGGALYLRSSSASPDEHPHTAGSTTSKAPAEPKTFTTQELATHDGKEGHACYVAVDGKVYEIDQGRLWQNGEHTTSHGEAHCGLDLSQAIAKSPHGKSKLEALTVVGTLVPAR
jgi:predicted heme/steroid binding protein